MHALHGSHGFPLSRSSIIRSFVSCSIFIFTFILMGRVVPPKLKGCRPVVVCATAGLWVRERRAAELDQVRQIPKTESAFLSLHINIHLGPPLCISSSLSVKKCF
ncbi:hypothetical protein B0H12DRAFT_1133903 [Mycena haematopus]|nr:hypothetical protein B0H12DRAFT_1133903 [Mycena haematopus]